MRTIVSILFIAFAFCAKAQDSSAIVNQNVETVTRCHQPIVHRITEVDSAVIKPYLIPRYQIPKGSVFCRMEDKLNRATKVWIKIGTNNNK